MLTGPENDLHGGSGQGDIRRVRKVRPENARKVLGPVGSVVGRGFERAQLPREKSTRGPAATVCRRQDGVVREGPARRGRCRRWRCGRISRSCAGSEASARPSASTRSNPASNGASSVLNSAGADPSAAKKPVAILPQPHPRVQGAAGLLVPVS